MIDRLFRGISKPAVLIGAAALAWGAAARAVDNAGDWQFTLTPYLWASGLDGDVTVRNRTVAVDVGFDDILDALDIGALLAFEARRGDWAVLADLIYLKLSADGSGPRGVVEADAEVHQTLLSAGIARTVLRSPAVGLEVLGGVRYVRLKAKLDLRTARLRESVTETKNWADPIVGLRGQIELGGQWFLPFYADVGGFGVASDLTWQALAGVGYGFSWGDVRLVYRYLDIDYEDGSFGYDTATSGPALGAAFRF